MNLIFTMQFLTETILYFVYLLPFKNGELLLENKLPHYYCNFYPLKSFVKCYEEVVVCDKDLWVQLSTDHSLFIYLFFIIFFFLQSLGT